MMRFTQDKECTDALPNGYTSRWLRGAGGAELNVMVALANLGWGGQSRWVSVVPSGRMGEELIGMASQACVDGGSENLSLVKRTDGDVGIYNAWPDEGRIAYQRLNSAFAQMDPDMFLEGYWRGLLMSHVQLHYAEIAPKSNKGDKKVKSAEAGPVQILHLTGITPLIGRAPRRAWNQALKSARRLKKEEAAGYHPSRLLVTMDLNHRPALGGWDELWDRIEPHLPTLDMLVLSVSDVVKIGAHLDVPAAAKMLARNPVADGLEGAPALEQAVEAALKAIQKELKDHHHTVNLVVCCKQRDTQKKKGPPVQLRWSMACMKDGTVASTFPKAIKQEVLEEIGGGDAWIAGTIDGLVGLKKDARVAAPNWTKEMWVNAMQQGDMLANLKQKQWGDFSLVTREELDAGLAAN